MMMMMMMNMMMISTQPLKPKLELIYSLARWLAGI